MDNADTHTAVFPVAHLPLVRAALDELEVLEVIDELCPRRECARVTDAECVASIRVWIG